MKDPTYSKEDIDKNPTWNLAFTMSELVNDNAPIGWGEYIMLSKMLLDRYEIRRKD